jgi:hypothetical protein
MMSSCTDINASTPESTVVFIGHSGVKVDMLGSVFACSELLRLMSANLNAYSHRPIFFLKLHFIRQ